MSATETQAAAAIVVLCRHREGRLMATQHTAAASHAPTWAEARAAHILAAQSTADELAWHGRSAN